MGVSQALEAGYITRTNTGTGGGNSGGKGRNNNGGSAGNSGGEHATARYVVNLPAVPVTPTDAPEQDTKSVNQTDNQQHSDEDKGSGANSNYVTPANDSNKREREQEERSVSQTALSDLSYDSNIESLLELEVESDVPATTVGKPDHQSAETAQAVADDHEEDEDERDDNEPDSGLHTAPSTSEPQEQPHAQSQAQAETGVRARSVYLANLSRDFSRELGDLAHGRSNSTQIHNLWRESGLSEKEFAGLLYQSRDLTRRYAVLRPGETPPAAGKPRNRMAYFFTVVRNMLGLRPHTATVAAAPVATSAPASTPTPASSHARPNLRYGSCAGEYKQVQVQAQAHGNNLPLPKSGMVSPPQTQLAYRQRQQAHVPSSSAPSAKVKVEKAHGQGQAVAPNGVKLLHASWLQFVR